MKQNKIKKLIFRLTQKQHLKVMFESNSKKITPSEFIRRLIENYNGVTSTFSSQQIGSYQFKENTEIPMICGANTIKDTKNKTLVIMSNEINEPKSINFSDVDVLFYDLAQFVDVSLTDISERNKMMISMYMESIGLDLNDKGIIEMTTNRIEIACLLYQFLMLFNIDGIKNN
jgi:hypothetical protein